MPKKGKDKKGTTTALAANASTFSERATALREQQTGGAAEEREGKPGDQGKESQSSAPPLDDASNLIPQMFAKDHIIPEIDTLIDKHKDGSGIHKDEVETAFKDIMQKMVESKMLTAEERDAYIAPSKIEKEVDVEVTRIVEKNPQHLGNRIINAVTRKEPEMVEKTFVEKQKIPVDGPSQFQKDIEAAVGGFNDQGKMESPNLESAKDKLLHSISRVCTSLGFSGLAASCRKSMSTEQQTSLKGVESVMAEITKKVVVAEVGPQVVVQERQQDPLSQAQRIGEQTKQVLEQRQQGKKTGAPKNPEQRERQTSF